jgi:hypothetical protein
MEILRSEQDIIRVLKEDSQKISECMTRNRCMSDGNCIHGKKPLDCYNQLEAERNTIKLIQKSAEPSDKEKNKDLT